MSSVQDTFASSLLHWFDAYGRHDLPWQHPRTPYRVWLSEIMLQQTQVTVVRGYFQRFVDALPDIPALAAASQSQVMALWSGLGYYSRARNLHTAAQQCVAMHASELPRDLDALIALPGIGRSTAGAILAQAWNDRFAILDGNVKRVLCRFHGIEGWPGTPAIEKQLWSLAEAHLPQTRLADYTQAQMDFGATLCARHRPKCTVCPLRTDCVAFQTGRTATIPSPKPKTIRPHREICMLLLHDARDRILLQQRPQTGIWAGLWSLPQFAEAAAARAWLSQWDSDAATSLRVRPNVRHGFTHFELTIVPVDAHVMTAPPAGAEDDLQWFMRQDIAQLGLPAPVRRLIADSPRQ